MVCKIDMNKGMAMIQGESLVELYKAREVIDMAIAELEKSATPAPIPVAKSPYYMRGDSHRNNSSEVSMTRLTRIAAGVVEDILDELDDGATIELEGDNIYMDDGWDSTPLISDEVMEDLDATSLRAVWDIVKSRLGDELRGGDYEVDIQSTTIYIE